MSNFSLRHDCLLLDACCAINLSVSGQMGAIISSLSVPTAISEYVYGAEVIGQKNSLVTADADPEHVINLQALTEAGLLQVTDLTSYEEIEAVNLSAAIDGGEAFTCAIAKHRGWAIATDDRRAISFFGETVPHLQIVTTPHLIKHWADTGKVEAAVVRKALDRVQALGRYEPPRDHPLYQWWRACRKHQD